LQLCAYSQVARMQGIDALVEQQRQHMDTKSDEPLIAN
jgi:hypothetical protein